MGKRSSRNIFPKGSKKPNVTQSAGIKKWTKKTLSIVILTVVIPYIVSIIFFYWVGLKFAAYLFMGIGGLFLLVWMLIVWIDKQNDSY